MSNNKVFTVENAIIVGGAIAGWELLKLGYRMVFKKEEQPAQANNQPDAQVASGGKK